MRSLENVLKATESLETELLREKASGLGRTAERLEALLARCAEVERRLDAAPPAERARLLDEHDQTRALAKTWLWYLCIQREAVGLRVHSDVEAMYPLPTSLRQRT